MALVGLKDDYVTDGRVLTEDLTISPGQTGDKKFLPLAVCYKQLNSSVGQFGTDVLVADTAALKTGSSGNDSTYQSVACEDQGPGRGAGRPGHLDQERPLQRRVQRHVDPERQLEHGALQQPPAVG